MECDFASLKEKITKMDEVIAREGSIPFLGGSMLAREIAKTLKPFLDKVSPDSPKDLRNDMEFLYSKAAEYAPYLSLMRFIKGQFYLSCNNANDAAKCFREAYDIDKDPTIKKWPHLQVTESNAKLISILGFSLQEAGDVEEGQKFLQAGQAMAGKIREKIASLDAPNPG